MKSAIVPFGAVAFTTIRPSGNLSASIFSPGRHQDACADPA
jgi:hypothetical protein